MTLEEHLKQRDDWCRNIDGTMDRDMAFTYWKHYMDGDMATYVAALSYMVYDPAYDTLSRMRADLAAKVGANGR